MVGAGSAIHGIREFDKMGSLLFTLRALNLRNTFLKFADYYSLCSLCSVRCWESRLRLDLASDLDIDEVPASSSHYWSSE